VHYSVDVIKRDLRRPSQVTNIRQRHFDIRPTPCPEKTPPPKNIKITSSNTTRFSKFFHFYNLLEICYKAIIKYPTTQWPHLKRIARLPCEKLMSENYSVSGAPWQSWWKINPPPESHRFRAAHFNAGQIVGLASLAGRSAFSSWTYLLQFTIWVWNLEPVCS